MRLSDKIKGFALSGTAEFAIIGTGSDEVREAYYELRNMVIHEGAEKHTGLTFGTALAALKEGHRVAREGWNGKGMWLGYVRWSTHTLTQVSEFDDNFNARPFIVLKDVAGLLVPWQPSQMDMLADDWMLVLPEYEKDKECPDDCGHCCPETEAEESLRP